jgi:hypothetical protein
MRSRRIAATTGLRTECFCGKFSNVVPLQYLLYSGLLPLPRGKFFPARRLRDLAIRTGCVAGIRQEKDGLLP